VLESKKGESTDAIEFATRWGLVVLAGLGALGALLRMYSSSLHERLDQTTLLYLGVSGGLLLLRQVRTFSLGQLKLEMIEKLQERQLRQEEKISDISLILPLLLQEKEVQHIRNLFLGRTENYQGWSGLRDELRRLRSMKLISMKRDRNVGDLRDGMQFDLANFVELTPLGQRWAHRIEEIQGGDAKPDVEQPQKTAPA
jgi:hypothetical protein